MGHQCNQGQSVEMRIVIGEEDRRTVPRKPLAVTQIEAEYERDQAGPRRAKKPPSRAAGSWSCEEGISEEMRKDRRRIGEAIDPVEHAAMAGNQLARILDARSRFTAESVMSPRKPATAMMAPASARPHNIHRGQMGPIIAATIDVKALPPRKPSQVFSALTVGVILCLPKSLPQVNCATSLNCAMKTRKKRSPAPPATRIGGAPSQRAGKPCSEMVNTVIIKPQLTVQTARRKARRIASERHDGWQKQEDPHRNEHHEQAEFGTIEAK